MQCHHAVSLYREPASYTGVVHLPMLFCTDVVPVHHPA